MTNLLKKRTSFTIALEGLQKGKKIKRISSEYGFVKMQKMAEGYKEEVYAKYRAKDPKPYESAINFDLEDVLAEDWIIDE